MDVGACAKQSLHATCSQAFADPATKQRRGASDARYIFRSGGGAPGIARALARVFLRGAGRLDALGCAACPRHGAVGPRATRQGAATIPRIATALVLESSSARWLSARHRELCFSRRLPDRYRSPGRLAFVQSRGATLALVDRVGLLPSRQGLVQRNTRRCDLNSRQSRGVP